MKPITGPALCRLLEAAGWQLQRIAGNHYIYTKTGERKILAVPVHGKADLKPGLASRLARDANLRW